MTEPRKYRTKTVEVEAELFDQDKKYKLSDQFRAVICNCASSLGENQKWHIHTLEGAMDISDGDFIIKGLIGEFYPCKPEAFHAKYEQVPSTAVVTNMMEGQT